MIGFDWRSIFVSAIVFGLMTGLSYIIRSDGHGLGFVADGMKRCGFPMLFWTQGGFIGTPSTVDPIAFGVDLLVSMAVGVSLAWLARQLR